MIELNNLQVKYDNFVAIEDLCLSIPRRSFFTLLGPSGCGKTTVLRAIAGLEKPSHGQVFLDNKDITFVPAELRNIGMVFQSYALFPSMTTYNNIAYGLEIENMRSEDVNQRVQEVAKLVGLNEEILPRYVSQLSGGQQQRVAIARTLAKNPDVVLFDEPLSNLDAKLRKKLRFELRRIQKEANLTVVYVTHDQEEALEISDLIAVLNVGNIEQIGTPAEVYNQSATEFVCTFLGDVNHLSDVFIRQLKRNCWPSLEESENHYIRQERVFINDVPKSKAKSARVKLEGVVEDVLFRGAFIQYKVKLEDDMVQSLCRNDTEAQLQVGDKCNVYLFFDDILTYTRKHD